MSKFSIDALDIALKTSLDEESCRNYEIMTEQIMETLRLKAEPKPKKSKGPKLPSDKDIFEGSIIPSIKQCIHDFEAEEMKGRPLKLELCGLEFGIYSMNIDQLMRVHVKIVAIQNSVEMYDIVVRFIRGCHLP